MRISETMTGCLPYALPPEIEPKTWICTLTRNGIGDLLVHGRMLNQLSHSISWWGKEYSHIQGHGWGNVWEFCNQSPTLKCLLPWEGKLSRLLDIDTPFFLCQITEKTTNKQTPQIGWVMGVIQMKNPYLENGRKQDWQ